MRLVQRGSLERTILTAAGDLPAVGLKPTRRLPPTRF